MKLCSYCGRENAEESRFCAECGKEFDAQAKVARRDAGGKRGDDPDWVTVVKCRTLMEADLLVARLRAAGIESFLPDEASLAAALPCNTYGYVRVQVPPAQFEAARALLEDRDRVA